MSSSSDTSSGSSSYSSSDDERPAKKRPAEEESSKGMEKREVLGTGLGASNTTVQAAEGPNPGKEGNLEDSKEAQGDKQEVRADPAGLRALESAAELADLLGLRALESAAEPEKKESEKGGERLDGRQQIADTEPRQQSREPDRGATNAHPRDHRYDRREDGRWKHDRYNEGDVDQTASARTSGLSARDWRRETDPGVRHSARRFTEEGRSYRREYDRSPRRQDRGDLAERKRFREERWDVKPRGGQPQEGSRYKDEDEREAPPRERRRFQEQPPARADLDERRLASPQRADSHARSGPVDRPHRDTPRSDLQEVRNGGRGAARGLDRRYRDGQDVQRGRGFDDRGRDDARWREGRRGGAGWGRVEKWSHDKFEEVNRSPSPKKDDSYAKIAALLAL